MKVRIFKFRVSNAASSPCRQDSETEWYRQCMSELQTAECMEKTVNGFLSTVDRVLDIRVNTVGVHYHNNARGNTVDLVYTVMYE